jgi:hypothetical protein
MNTLGGKLLFTVLLVALAAPTFGADAGFASLCTYIRAVHLDSTVSIAWVSDLDVNQRGEFLVTDQVGKSLFTFSAAGKLLRRWKPDSCHPGFVFFPLACRYNRRGEVYIINNASPLGYRFSVHGECLGPLDRWLPRSEYVCFSPSHELIFYNWSDVALNPIVLCDSEGRTKTTCGDRPEQFLGYIYRLGGGGVVSDDSGNIYLANVAEPRIYKYDRTCRPRGSFSQPPSYYKALPPLPRGLGLQPGSHATIAKTSAGKTLVSRLFLVTKKSLLLTYDNQDGTFGYQIFDLDGRCRSPESVLDRYDIILAKDGMVYTVSQPAPRQDGTLPNPTIGVYLLRIKE